MIHASFLFGPGLDFFQSPDARPSGLFFKWQISELGTGFFLIFRFRGGFQLFRNTREAFFFP